MDATPPHSTPHPAALSARQAADMLGVHEKTVRRWIERGKLGAVKDAAGAFQIDPDDVERRRAAVAADTQHTHAAPAANMPQSSAARAADTAAPYAAGSIDLQPLADLIERQGQEIRRLTEAATVWQIRAVNLEQQLKQLTAGPGTIVPTDDAEGFAVTNSRQQTDEPPQSDDVASGRAEPPRVIDESISGPFESHRGRFARWWDAVMGR